MTSDKSRIVEGLHTLHNSIYDAKEYLSDMIATKRVIELYTQLNQIEADLEQILDDDYWT